MTAEAGRSVRSPRQLEVCLVSHFALPSMGGVETYTDSLARYLVASGHRVRVVTATPGDAGDGTYEIHRGPSPIELFRVFKACDVVQFNSLNPFQFALARLVGKPTIDVHHDYHAICPIGTAWWQGRACSFDPRLCGRHLGGDRGPRGVIRPVVAFLARRFATRRADANVVFSDFAIRRLALPRMHQIPNGVASPDRVGEALPDDAARRDFLFVGRLIAGKGVDVLIRAFQSLAAEAEQQRLIVCGSGPQEPELRALVTDLGLEGRVSFLGGRSPSEVRNLMSDALALVVPSLWDEPMPLVVLEAFSVGTPVIAANTGGLGDVTRSRGLVFERGNAAELAARMTDLIDRPGLRQELSAVGRRSFESNYSIDVMGAAYVNLYRQLLEAA